MHPQLVRLDNFFLNKIVVVVKKSDFIKFYKSTLCFYTQAMIKVNTSTVKDDLIGFTKRKESL